MKHILKTIWSLLSAVWDLLVLHTPIYLVYKLRRPGVAFLVHPRNMEDIYRPYPAFKWLPDKLVKTYGRKIGAIKLSTMQVGKTGLRAELLSIVMDPAATEKTHRKDLYRNCVLAYRLATRRNMRLVGLGAWLPALTKYGHSLQKNRDEVGDGSAVTTGHALTAWCILETLKTLLDIRHVTATPITVGVVGAAGSTGGLTARLLEQVKKDGHQINLLLVDQPSKKKTLLELGEKLKATTATELASLQQCDYVVVVTNAPQAIIRPEHIKPGVVIIDDSQPRNTSVDLNEKGIVVDVLASVSGLNANFDFGFQTTDTAVTFSCLAETILLGLVGHTSDFSVGTVPAELVADVEWYLTLAKQKGVQIGPAKWYSFAEPLSEARIHKLLEPIDVIQAAE